MLLCLKMGQCRNLQLHPVLSMTNQKKSGDYCRGMVLMGSSPAAQPFRWSNSVGSNGFVADFLDSLTHL